MLAKIFISPFVDQGNARRYTWDAATFNAIKDTDNDAPLGVKDFVQTNPDRLFLIVGGTMIYQHPAYDYPRLIPVEYTPLYTGVRQQYGERLGGIYVSPYAYDAVAAASPEATRVRVTLKSDGRPFTLADMIGSSGAAPLLALYRGVPPAELKRATVTFPTFNHFSVRTTASGLAATAVVTDLLGRGYKNFPWFATFEQNKPYLVKLHAEQVQLLSKFTSWMVTDPAGRAEIERVMGAVLQ